MIYKVKCVCDKCKNEYEYTTNQHEDIYTDEEETEFNKEPIVCEKCDEIVNQHILQIIHMPEF